MTDDLTTRKPTATGLATRRPHDTTTGITAFVRRSLQTAAAAQPDRKRVIYAFDATASRQGTWDAAAQLMAEMIEEVAGVEAQVAYYRGHNECRSTAWFSDPAKLVSAMTPIMCIGGHTQIRRVLAHSLSETKKKPVAALVFVGDACEGDEKHHDQIAATASELGRLGCRCFMFQEGDDSATTALFRRIAELSGGACAQFNDGAAHQLKELLGMVAAYATGGLPALERKRGTGRLLTFFGQ